MDEAILVGIPTYAGGRYCRDALIRNLSLLTTKNLSFVFVTNSGEEDAQDLRERTKPLSHVTILETNACPDVKDQIVHNRNVIRDHFLEREYTHLYFVDHDILQPKNALAVLISHDKKLVTGWYLGAFTYGEKTHVLPIAYARDAPGRSRQLAIVDVLTPRLIKITCAGLGCALIHKDILKKVRFSRGKGTEDAIFYENVRKCCSEPLWLDTRVACVHVKHPLGDRRNAFMDPRNYSRKS